MNLGYQTSLNPNSGFRLENSHWHLTVVEKNQSRVDQLEREQVSD